MTEYREALTAVAILIGMRVYREEAKGVFDPWHNSELRTATAVLAIAYPDEQLVGEHLSLAATEYARMLRETDDRGE